MVFPVEGNNTTNKLSTVFATNVKQISQAIPPFTCKFSAFTEIILGKKKKPDTSTPSDEVE